MQALDDLHGRKVDGVSDFGCGAADGYEGLAETKVADRADGGVQQGGAAKREQLFRLAEPSRRPSRQYQPSDIPRRRIDHAVDVSEHYGGNVYGIALSVAACLRGGTRVDVAWTLDPHHAPSFDATDAVAITPGGGRLGSLLGGALDSRLVELATAEPTEARVVPIELDPIEAAAVGAEPGTQIRIVFSPASVLPDAVWEPLLERRPVRLDATVIDGRLADVTIGAVPSSVAFVLDGASLRCDWSPTPTIVVFGGGPMADALGRGAEFVGWNVQRVGGAEHAIGIAPTLSPIDGLVVMGHETEAVGRVLQAALGSRVGYIGSIGPAALQEDRGDWLAYRGVTDTSRIHGPAGFDIGATSPEEVALSVICEMISVRNESAT